MFTSTTTPLAGNATWTSNPRMTNEDDTVGGIVASDQTGTLFLEQSFDPKAIDPLTAGSAAWTPTSVTVTAADNKVWTVALVAPFWRVRYVNGATLQGSFSLYAKTVSSGNST